MRALFDWSGLDVLDVGCGTGFHLPWFADSAARVVGVEPHPDLAAIAARRCRRLDTVSVLTGTAQHLPLPDDSIDFVHARWAYFFGPGCEPGLAELERVVRRGGLAVVIDNDATTSTFGSWFRRGHPAYDPATVARFWSGQGWQRVPVEMGWAFGSRAELSSVVRIEFDRSTAEAVLAEHDGLDVDYAVNLWWRNY